jgi:SAM-dependent methyltransferase
MPEWSLCRLEPIPAHRATHTECMAPKPWPEASTFNDWYTEMAGSSLKDEIVQRHLGLPPALLSSSLLGWEGIGEAVAALGLRPDGTLLDLACGRGGYGLEVAARTGAALIGVDFSAEAVRQARDHARRLDRAAEFLVGDLAATGLDSGSVNGVLCVDAIQFARQPGVTYAELLRVLVPGGRAVLTSWETASSDERIPERLRLVDLHDGLTAAGFVNVKVLERPSWRERERELWEEAAGLDPGDDPALQSLHDEAVRVLPVFDLMRRVMATASAPAVG